MTADRIETPFLVRPDGGTSYMGLLRFLAGASTLALVIGLLFYPVAGVAVLLACFLGAAELKDRRDAHHAETVATDMAGAYAITVPVSRVLELMRTGASDPFAYGGRWYQLEHDVEPCAANDYRLPRIAVAAVSVV